jgi:ComF family protein
MGIGGAHPGRGVGTGFSLSARTALDSILALVIAPACAACASVLEAPLAGPICPQCWASIPPASLAWRAPSPALDHVFSAGIYDGRLRDIIHAWKFERRQSLARPLAGLVRDRCAGALHDDVIAVPVPMTPWRRWHRGFNQAEDLTARLGLPWTRALARWRPRPAQATLHSAERRLNLDSAVIVPAWRRRAVAGRSVLLVDDVVTTGATLAACAVALRRAGAADVRAVTVARTMLKG